MHNFIRKKSLFKVLEMQPDVSSSEQHGYKLTDQISARHANRSQADAWP